MKTSKSDRICIEVIQTALYGLNTRWTEYLDETELNELSQKEKLDISRKIGMVFATVNDLMNELD